MQPPGTLPPKLSTPSFGWSIFQVMCSLPQTVWRSPAFGVRAKKDNTWTIEEVKQGTHLWWQRTMRLHFSAPDCTFKQKEHVHYTCFVRQATNLIVVCHEQQRTTVERPRSPPQSVSPPWGAEGLGELGGCLGTSSRPSGSVSKATTDSTNSFVHGSLRHCWLMLRS